MLSDEEQAKVDQYRRLLYTTTEATDSLTGQPEQVAAPTPMRQAYEAGRQAYEAASQHYQSLRLTATTTTDTRTVLDFNQNAPLYRRRVQDAMTAWVTTGYKNEVEMMEAYIAQMTGQASTP